MAKEYYLKYEPECITMTDMHSVCCMELPELDPYGCNELQFFYDNLDCEDIEVVRSQTMNQLYPSGLMMIVDGCFLLHEEMKRPNPIATSIAGQIILGAALIGRLGDRNGEPDIIGFDSEEDANEIAADIRRWIKDTGKFGYIVF